MDVLTFKTERLLLRPWKIEDAEALYELAQDPRIGPAAGWPTHTSVENSRQIIKEVLSGKESYAIVLKGSVNAIGSIGMTFYQRGEEGSRPVEGEIGYWIGVPYWGRGLVPEAVSELMRHGFEDLGLEAIWCGYFDGNEKSKRVQEKCGFTYHHTKPDVFCAPMNETRVEHFTRITRDEWENLKHK